jgi:hypothetical protein
MIMGKLRNLFVMLAGLFITTMSNGQDVKWIIMARGGSAYNFKTGLVIKQEEYPDIRFKAKYATKPFATPPYYDFHIVRWKRTNGWGLKITHHKLYLINNPSEVQRFTITDGFNIFTLTRQWKIAGFIYHIGGGVVITHPESVIRGPVIICQDQWQKLLLKKGLIFPGDCCSLLKEG